MPLAVQEQHRQSIYDHFYVVQNNFPESFGLVDGIKDVLRHFWARNFVQTIVTSRNQDPLRHLLEYHDIAGCFDFISSRDRALELGLADKPMPDKLEDAMKAVGVGPQHTVVIGDTWMDVRMGYDAGCQGSGGGMGIWQCG